MKNIAKPGVVSFYIIYEKFILLRSVS